MPKTRVKLIGRIQEGRYPCKFTIEIEKFARAMGLELPVNYALDVSAPVLAEQYTENFRDLFFTQTGHDLDASGYKLVHVIFLDELARELHPRAVFREFFVKHLPRYIATVERVAKIGQQHAPGGVLTARPKPMHRRKHENEILSFRWYSPEKIQWRFSHGIENAYLESMIAVGKTPVRGIVENVKTWALRDLVTTIVNVGAMTGAYNIRADWEVFLDGYQPKMPTYERVRDAIFGIGSRNSRVAV